MYTTDICLFLHFWKQLRTTGEESVSDEHYMQA